MTGCMPCVVSVNVNVFVFVCRWPYWRCVLCDTIRDATGSQRLRLCRVISQLSSVHFFFHQIWLSLVKVADRKGIWFFDHHDRYAASDRRISGCLSLFSLLRGDIYTTIPSITTCIAYSIMYTLTIFGSGSAIVITIVLQPISYLIIYTGYIRSDKRTPQKLRVDVDL